MGTLDVTGGTSGSDAGQFTAASSEGRSLEVFISYRREDAAANAGRLADALVARFGRESVFMDVDTIEPGADYTEAIDKAVGHCDVLIALIGPRWLDAANSRGRRLDDPQDLVRLEIESALARNIRVIPTLVGGAVMPGPDQLPGTLASLAKRNALELSHTRFQADLQLLLKPLEKLAQQKRGTVTSEVPSPVAPSVATGASSITLQRAGSNLPSMTVASTSKAPEHSRRQIVRASRWPLIAGAVVVLLILGSFGAFAVNRLKLSSAPSKTANVLVLPSGYVATWKGSGHESSPSGDFAIAMTIRAGQVGQVVGDLDRPTLNCKYDLVLDKATTQSIILTEQGLGTCYLGGQGVASAGHKILATLSGTSLDWKEYPGDPSAGSAVAAATLTRGTSGTIPGTSNLVAVPDSFVATWKGSGHESNPSGDFAIAMTIRAGQVGQVVGDLDRPTLNCKYDLVLDKATTQSIILTEQGLGTCYLGGQGVASAGHKVLATLSGSSLDWKEYPGDPSAKSATATATLAQGASGPIPGTSNLIAVPDSFVATWKGSGHESSPSGDFAITMTIRAGQVGQVVGDIDRPTLNCKYDLVLDKATTQSIILTEQGLGTCYLGGQGVASAGHKIMATLSGKSLDWKEYPGDPSAKSATATATLAMS